MKEKTKEISFSKSQIDLIKTTIAKGCTDEELHLFLAQCKRTQLDPFQRQIFAVKRYNSKTQKEEMAIQISIDGFRIIAERSGQYRGQKPAEFCDQDGIFSEVWLKETSPYAAKVGVIREGFSEPVYAVALYRSYVQLNKEKFPIGLWAKSPEIMLAKCAEALALRKTFPNDLSGLYAEEELGHIEREIEEPKKIEEIKEPEEDKFLKKLKGDLSLCEDFVKLSEINVEWTNSKKSHTPAIFNEGRAFILRRKKELGEKNAEATS